jgi:hypothetical protein
MHKMNVNAILSVRVGVVDDIYFINYFLHEMSL